MLDRKLQPAINQIDKIKILEARNYKLSNNIPVYYINAGEQDVVKIDFIFLAGTINHENPLVADMTNSMLDEGTKNRSSEKIAQEIDFYGAFLSLNVGRHTAIATIYTLNKYINEAVELIYDLVKNPVFAEKEFNTIIKHNYQNFIIDKDKTSELSNNKFKETIFGKNTAYGRLRHSSDFKSVNKEQLVEFHANNYDFSNLNIIISGKINDNHFKILDKFFGQVKIGKSATKLSPNFNFEDNKSQKIFVEKKDAVQSSISIGMRMINRSNPDFLKLNIANIILGGYFGSRLMTNIREDKGYTYGIYSSVVPMIKSGYFIVSAETGKDVCEKAVTEIFKEIEILRTEKVSKEELARVKNYLSGNFVSNFNGAFSLAEAFKVLLNNNLSYDYYYDYFDTIKSISSEEILDVAQKYLNPEKMFTVVAGSK